MSGGAGPEIVNAFLRRGDVSIDISSGNPAMDYEEHYRTYHGFLKGAKYLLLLVALTLVLMAVFLL